MALVPSILNPMLATVLEEAPPASDTDVGISGMLLGNFAFVMSLFYIVNHPDSDMRRYSWSVISSTISIFIAVMVFQGLDNSLVALLVPEGESAEFWHMVLNFSQQFVWFWILQLVLGVGHLNYVGGKGRVEQEVRIGGSGRVCGDSGRFSKGNNGSRRFSKGSNGSRRFSKLINILLPVPAPDRVWRPGRVDPAGGRTLVR